MNLLEVLLLILDQAGRLITENVLVALIVMLGPILTTITTALLARKARRKEGEERDAKLEAAVTATVPQNVHKEITDSLNHRIAELEQENIILRGTK